MEAQVGQLQAQLAQTQAEQQYAIEQIRILTIQVNNSASAATSAATATAPSTTAAPADAPTGSHSQTPKVNYHFGQDIIPSIFDGKQRTDFREWAENSASYLSTQCVDACEILLERLVMEKKHVAEAAIRAKCEEEDWEFDSISTHNSFECISQFVFSQDRLVACTRAEEKKRVACRFVQHHVDVFVIRQVQVPGTHIAGSSCQWPPVSAARTTCVEPVRSI